MFGVTRTPHRVSPADRVMATDSGCTGATGATGATDALEYTKHPIHPLHPKHPASLSPLARMRAGVLASDTSETPPHTGP